MNTKENMLTNISEELEKEFGKPGTPERIKFDEEAYAFYTSQILFDVMLTMLHFVRIQCLVVSVQMSVN